MNTSHIVNHDANTPVLNTVTIVFTVISCSFSILGAFAIFVLYFKYPEIRTPSKTMLIFLTIADLLTATGNLVGVVRYIFVSTITPFETICTADGHNPELAKETVCVVQSFVTVFSSLSSFFWTTAISFFLLLPVAKEGLVLGKRFKITCHVVCWSIPASIAIVAASLEKLGEDNVAASSGWCWIDKCVLNKLTWMLLTGKAWEMTVYVITGVNYILLKCFLVEIDHRATTAPVWERHTRYPTHENKFRDEDRRFIYVPLLLYTLRIWGTIRFFIDRLDESGNNTYALLTMQGIGDSLQAFMNFVVFFVCDGTIRRRVVMDIGSIMWQRRPREPYRGDETSHLFASDSYSYS